MNRFIVALAVLLSLPSMQVFAVRGGAVGAHPYNHPYYNERNAYNRGLENGLDANAGGGGFVDGVDPYYAPPTQGIQETPGDTDPYKSNDSIIPSYDQD